MNGGTGNGKIENEYDDDEVESTDLTDTVVMTEDLDDDDDIDSIIDTSVEAVLEVRDASQHRKEVRRRLEELEERRRAERELDSTFNFNLDDEL